MSQDAESLRRPSLMTVEDVSRSLRLGRSKVYELLARGELRSVRIDGSRRVRAQDLAEFVEQLKPDEPPTMPGVVTPAVRGR